MTHPPRGTGASRIARIRLEKRPESALAARERPPVFHVFEELYARTLREMQARSSAAAVTAGNR